jgi:hypothetical protein
MELAVAGQAGYLVTRNVRDLRGGELKRGGGAPSSPFLQASSPSTRPRRVPPRVSSPSASAPPRRDLLRVLAEFLDSHRQ